MVNQYDLLIHILRGCLSYSEEIKKDTSKMSRYLKQQNTLSDHFFIIWFNLNPSMDK